MIINRLIAYAQQRYAMHREYRRLVAETRCRRRTSLRSERSSPIFTRPPTVRCSADQERSVRSAPGGIAPSRKSVHAGVDMSVVARRMYHRPQVSNRGTMALVYDGALPCLGRN